MKERITVSVSTGTIIRTVVILILFAGLFYISDFIVALLVSVVLASSLELPVSALAKKGIPRAVSVSLIFLLLISILATIVLVFIPPLADDIALFVKNLPKVLDSVRIFGRDMGFKDMALYVQSLSRDIF
jgi:putative permease